MYQASVRTLNGCLLLITTMLLTHEDFDSFEIRPSLVERCIDESCNPSSKPNTGHIIDCEPNGGLCLSRYRYTDSSNLTWFAWRIMLLNNAFDAEEDMDI